MVIIHRKRFQSKKELPISFFSSVSASNIGYTKARERSQGKGGDLRSKYNLTLTVVRKQYNGKGLFGKPCRTALDTFIAARLCPQALPHDARVLCQHLVGRLHSFR